MARCSSMGGGIVASVCAVYLSVRCPLHSWLAHLDSPSAARLGTGERRGRERCARWLCWGQASSLSRTLHADEGLSEGAAGGASGRCEKKDDAGPRTLPGFGLPGRREVARQHVRRQRVEVTVGLVRRLRMVGAMVLVSRWRQRSSLLGLALLDSRRPGCWQSRASR